MMKMRMIFPSFFADRPHVAECEVEFRLTPTMIVVTKADPKTIVYVNGNTRGPTGISKRRFYRATGQEVGGDYRTRSWSILASELERINAESLAKGGAECS